MASSAAPMVARPLPTVDEVKARLNRLTQAIAKAKTIIGNEVHEVELRLKSLEQEARQQERSVNAIKAGNRLRTTGTDELATAASAASSADAATADVISADGHAKSSVGGAARASGPRGEILRDRHEIMQGRGTVVRPEARREGRARAWARGRQNIRPRAVARRVVTLLARWRGGRGSSRRAPGVSAARVRCPRSDARRVRVTCLVHASRHASRCPLGVGPLSLVPCGALLQRRCRARAAGVSTFAIVSSPCSVERAARAENRCELFMVLLCFWAR